MLRNFGLKLGRVSEGGHAARVRELADGNAMLETMAEAMLRAHAALREELAGWSAAFGTWRSRTPRAGSW